MPYVYSTITNTTEYCEYKTDPEARQLPILLRKVAILGGSGVANKHMVTPRGVVTKVTDDELEFLKGNKAFQRHMARGFIRIDTAKIDADLVAADMTKGDDSAPKTPETIGEVPGGAKVSDGSSNTFRDKISNLFAG